MNRKCKLIGYILYENKGRWLITSKDNYFSEHVDMSKVEDLGDNYGLALIDATLKYGVDVTVLGQRQKETLQDV